MTAKHVARHAHLLEFCFQNLEALPVVVGQMELLKESGNDKTAELCGGDRKVETGVEGRRWH
jgi:hypothetical protein